MSNYEVQYVEISGGRKIPAALLVCPKCNKLNLGMTFDSSKEPLQAHCPCGQVFEVREHVA